MSEPVKGNTEIGQDQAAFMRTLARARTELTKLDGVVDVGIGHKQTGGKYSYDVSLQVFVLEKRPESELAPEDRIPPTFEGYRTDVMKVPRVKPIACNDSNRYATIRGGIQIMPWCDASDPTAPTGRGTLGCIVRRYGRDEPDNVYLLTCEHVLRGNDCKAGDTVYHPTAPPLTAPGTTTVALGPSQYSVVPENGMVKCTVPMAPGPELAFNQFPTVPLDLDEFYVDCGIARIDVASACCGSTCGENVVPWDATIAGLRHTTAPASPPEIPPANPPDTPPEAPETSSNFIRSVRSVARDARIAFPTGPGGTPHYVYKVGRTTGRTRGIIRSLLSPVIVGTIEIRKNVMTIEYAAADDLIPFNCVGHSAFAEPGDSGSIVVDEYNNAIGMVYGAEPDLPPGAVRWMTYACHILPVLDALGICIITSHGKTFGNCASTEGGGTAPLRTATAAERAPDPDIRPIGSSARDTLPAPEPISAARRDRLDALRDSFRETARGRALLDAFTDFHREIGYLVRHVRPVTVAWHRHRGPAFLALAIEHFRGDAPSIPRAIGGVARDTLLARMAAALAAHGSNALRRIVAEQGDALRTLLAGVETVDELLERLREATPADAAT